MEHVDEKNLMKESKITITINGSGKSKNEALGNIFSKLRKDIYKKIDGYILYMEPERFFIDELHIKKYTERFMFIFMPREKEIIYLTATIIVKVKYVKF